MLILRCSYHPKMLEEMKLKIPTQDRKWNPVDKVWLVTYRHGKLLQELCANHLWVDVTIPAPPKQFGKLESKLFRLDYLGQCRSRNGAESSAFGWVDGGFNYIFPEKVLRAWFKDSSKPGEAKNFYAVLAIDQSATDAEVKAAYRRLAKQYHPDVNKESGAAEQFKIVNHAYQILGDPITRKKYNVGLMFMAQAEKDAPQATVPASVDGYRAPLKCGYVYAEGVSQLGRFVVSKILQWVDVLNEQGETLVTWWPDGATAPASKWVGEK